MRDKFFQELQFYNRDQIPPQVFRKLTAFVNNPQAAPDPIASVSKAASQLSRWLHAIHSYGDILRTLQPKKDAVQKAEDNINEVLITTFQCR